MEVLFLAVVMGCADDFSLCDRVAEIEVAAESAAACAELTLNSEDAARVDYPTVRAECHLIEDPAVRMADAS